MDFALRMMDFVLKNDGLCTENDGFCRSATQEVCLFCILNDEFRIGTMMSFVSKMMIFVLKMMTLYDK